MKDLWTVYMVECSDGTYYTGSTNNLFSRIRTHNSGNGAKYTKSRLPVKLRWYGEWITKNAALKLEAKIKKLSRYAKKTLIDEYELIL